MVLASKTFLNTKYFYKNILTNIFYSGAFKYNYWNKFLIEL